MSFWHGQGRVPLSHRAEGFQGPALLSPPPCPVATIFCVCWGSRAQCRAWEGGTPGFPQAMAESQAAIWLPLAWGGRGLGGAGLVAGWGRDAGAACVWDDSGPMITACAHSGRVNRRRRGKQAEEVKEGKLGGWGLVEDSSLLCPCPHLSWQAP